MNLGKISACNSMADVQAAGLWKDMNRIFWSKVNKTGDCWEWTASLNSSRHWQRCSA